MSNASDRCLFEIVFVGVIYVVFGWDRVYILIPYIYSPICYAYSLILVLQINIISSCSFSFCYWLKCFQFCVFPNAIKFPTTIYFLLSKQGENRDGNQK